MEQSFLLGMNRLISNTDTIKSKAKNERSNIITKMSHVVSIMSYSHDNPSRAKLQCCCSFILSNKIVYLTEHGGEICYTHTILWASLVCISAFTLVFKSSISCVMETKQLKHTVIFLNEDTTSLLNPHDLIQLD